MVEKQQKKAQSSRYYIACPNAPTVPTRKPQKSQIKHKHNACKEPWPQDEKHDISKIPFLKQKTTRNFLNFLEMEIAQDCAHVLKNMFPQNFVNINDMII